MDTDYITGAALMFIYWSLAGLIGRWLWERIGRQ